MTRHQNQQRIGMTAQQTTMGVEHHIVFAFVGARSDPYRAILRLPPAAQFGCTLQQLRVDGQVKFDRTGDLDRFRPRAEIAEALGLGFGLHGEQAHFGEHRLSQFTEAAIAFGGTLGQASIGQCHGNSALGALMATLPRPGQVRWIGLRPARDVPMQAVDRVEVVAGKGLVGDRYQGGSGKRGITLIQAEHLPAIAALAQRPDLTPALLRRNVVVSGIPLIALKQRRFRIGTVVFEGTEECDPCSRMEDALGPGGYNAMRGHGGLCARILSGGRLALGDAVIPLEDA